MTSFKSASSFLAMPGHEELGKEIRKAADFPDSNLIYHIFNDGGIELSLPPLGSSVFILSDSKSIWDLLLVIQTLQKKGVSKIIPIIPFIPYARSHQFDFVNPLSFLGRSLKQAGATHLITVDLHFDQAEGFFDYPVTHLHFYDLIIDDIKKRFDCNHLRIVAPDSGAVKRAEKLSDMLGCPLSIIQKKRQESDRLIQRILGEVQGAHCIIIDDLVDSGETLNRVTDYLIQSGASQVDAYVTHCFLKTPYLIKQLNSLTISHSISFDKRWDRIRLCSIAPLIAEAVQKLK